MTKYDTKLIELHTPLYEGGDEPEAAAEQKVTMTKEQRKAALYGKDTEGFSAKDNSDLGDGCVVSNDKRKMTDVICLILFTISLIAMCVVTTKGYTNGNVLKLLAPIDQNSLICGHNTTSNSTGTTQSEAEGFKYLYITDLVTGNPFNSGWCVKECPATKTAKIQFYPLPGKAAPTIAGGQYATKDFFGYCFPTQVSDLNKSQQKNFAEIKKQLLDNPVGEMIQNMQKASKSIYIGMFMSIIWCLVFIYVISAFAEQIAWGIIVATNAGVFIASALCFNEWNHAPLNSHNEKPKEFLYYGSIIAIIAMIMLCCILCSYKSLKVAIDVIDASADFTTKTKRIIGVSVGYFIFQMIIFVIWAFSVACLWSWGDIQVESVEKQAKNTIFAAGQAQYFYYALYFMIFMIVWILEWFTAKVNFITMHSASSYYFTSTRQEEGDADVTAAFKATYFYHAGSLAFGSFIIAAVKVIDFLLTVVLEHALQQSGDNAAVKLLVRCAECCMACIEKIVDYINKSAYAYMAITGDSFCTSAWNGFMLQLKHGMGFVFAKFLAEMFILLGKIFITMINCLFTYCVMKYGFKDYQGDDAITSSVGPLFVVAFVSYLSACVFLGLFDETALALMTCVSMDTDLNGTPKHGPATFHSAWESSLKASEEKNGVKVEEEGGDASNTMV